MPPRSHDGEGPLRASQDPPRRRKPLASLAGFGFDRRSPSPGISVRPSRRGTEEGAPSACDPTGRPRVIASASRTRTDGRGARGEGRSGRQPPRPPHRHPPVRPRGRRTRDPRRPSSPEAEHRRTQCSCGGGCNELRSRVGSPTRRCKTPGRRRRGAPERGRGAEPRSRGPPHGREFHSIALHECLRRSRAQETLRSPPTGTRLGARGPDAEKDGASHASAMRGSQRLSGRRDHEEGRRGIVLPAPPHPDNLEHAIDRPDGRP